MTNVLFFAYDDLVGCVSSAVVAAISVVLVTVAVILCLMLWWFKTRKGVANCSTGRPTETVTSQDDTVMRESSAYDRIQPAVRTLDSEIKMQESRAYVGDVWGQPTNIVPLHETVTEGHHAETQ